MRKEADRLDLSSILEALALDSDLSDWQGAWLRCPGLWQPMSFRD